MAYPFDLPSFYGPGIASIYLAAKTGQPFFVFWFVVAVYAIPYLFSWWILGLSGPLDVWYLLSKLILIPTCGVLIGGSIAWTSAGIWTKWKQMFSFPWLSWKHSYITWIHTIMALGSCVFLIIVMVTYEFTWYWVWYWMETMVIVLLTASDVIRMLFIHWAPMHGIRETEEAKSKIKWGIIYTDIVIWICYIGYSLFAILFRFRLSLLGGDGEDFWTVMIGMAFAAFVAIVYLVGSLVWKYAYLNRKALAERNFSEGGAYCPPPQQYKQ